MVIKPNLQNSCRANSCLCRAATLLQNSSSSLACHFHDCMSSARLKKRSISIFILLYDVQTRGCSHRHPPMSSTSLMLGRISCKFSCSMSHLSCTDFRVSANGILRHNALPRERARPSTSFASERKNSAGILSCRK